MSNPKNMVRYTYRGQVRADTGKSITELASELVGIDFQDSQVVMSARAKKPVRCFVDTYTDTSLEETYPIVHVWTEDAFIEWHEREMTKWSFDFGGFDVEEPTTRDVDDLSWKVNDIHKWLGALAPEAPPASQVESFPGTGRPTLTGELSDPDPIRQNDVEYSYTGLGVYRLGKKGKVVANYSNEVRDRHDPEGHEKRYWETVSK